MLAAQNDARMPWQSFKQHVQNAVDPIGPKPDAQSSHCRPLACESHCGRVGTAQRTTLGVGCGVGGGVGGTGVGTGAGVGEHQMPLRHASVL